MAFLKCLDLSTAHVTNSDRLMLDQGSGDRFDRVEGQQWAVRFQVSGEYGWVVWPPGKEGMDAQKVYALKEEGWSDAFINILKLASEDGDCMIINFDRDAEHHPGLPSFDWEDGDGNTPEEDDDADE